MPLLSCSRPVSFSCLLLFDDMPSLPTATASASDGLEIAYLSIEVVTREALTYYHVVGFK